jgi:hypothetical protein
MAERTSMPWNTAKLFAAAVHALIDAPCPVTGCTRLACVLYLTPTGYGYPRCAYHEGLTSWKRIAIYDEGPDAGFPPEVSPDEQ